MASGRIRRGRSSVIGFPRLRNVTPSGSSSCGSSGLGSGRTALITKPSVEAACGALPDTGSVLTTATSPGGAVD